VSNVRLVIAESKIPQCDDPGGRNGSVGTLAGAANLLKSNAGVLR